MKKFHVLFGDYSFACLKQLSAENKWSLSDTLRAAIQKMSGKVFDAEKVARFKIGQPAKKWV